MQLARAWRAVARPRPILATVLVFGAVPLVAGSGAGALADRPSAGPAAPGAAGTDPDIWLDGRLDLDRLRDAAGIRPPATTGLAALAGAAGRARSGGSVALPALGGIPPAALSAYRAAAATLARENPRCGLTWSVLAGIGRVESDHAARGGATRPGWNGTASPAILGPLLDGSGGFAAVRDTDRAALDGSPVWDRAVGPMQFLPASWRAYGADGNGDGRSNPQNIADASLAAARYLCAGGADLGTQSGLAAAVYSYNHSATYVALVLGIAASYARASTGSAPLALPPGGTSGYRPQVPLPTGSEPPVLAAPATSPPQHPPTQPPTTQPPTTQPPTTQPPTTQPPTTQPATTQPATTAPPSAAASPEPSGSTPSAAGPSSSPSPSPSPSTSPASTPPSTPSTPSTSPPSTPPTSPSSTPPTSTPPTSTPPTSPAPAAPTVRLSRHGSPVTLVPVGTSGTLPRLPGAGIGWWLRAAQPGAAGTTVLVAAAGSSGRPGPLDPAALPVGRRVMLVTATGPLSFRVTGASTATALPAVSTSGPRRLLLLSYRPGAGTVSIVRAVLDS